MPVVTDISSRAIAHYDLDAFFVSVEQKLNPGLKDLPLIVGGKGKRGVVAACSYETRAFGVHSAMPMVQALRLCPDAIVIPPNRQHYQKYSQIVTQIINGYAPVFEKASIDEFYVDFTTLGSFTACYDIATALRQEIMQKTQLPISFALSQNKLVSKIAVDTVKPNGQISITPGTEETFLAPMKVEKIPMVGRETAARFHKMGIFTIAQLAQCSRDTLRTFFGKHGELLAERARGKDPTPVSDERKQKSISTETTFEEDISDPGRLKEAFLRLNGRNASQLQQSGHFTACVAIKIRFNNFETINRQMTISPTASEEPLDRYILSLFRKYYSSGPYAGKRVRLIGVRYTHLLQEGFQLDLFEQSQSKLEEAITRLKSKFEQEDIPPTREL